MDKKAAVKSLVLMLVLTVIVYATVAYAAPKKCSNGVDDDNDGLKDYPADPGCSGMNDNTETSPSLVCDNGIDETNDADTLADFRLSGGDPGCTSTTDTSEVDGECDDTVDNADQDTLADYPTDLGCASFGDQNETGQCEDFVDNDADTHTDFTSNGNGDSKCVSFTDNQESPKDSCSDSDGGINYFVQGTASGDDNDVPFSNTDACLNADLLREWFCGGKSQDYDPIDQVISCSNQTNSTGCSAGRCL